MKNIYKDEELNAIGNNKKSLYVRKEGERTVRRRVDVYNLDATIAVGYRVNSKKATQFRIWATKILRRYLTDGFSLDQKKLVKSEKDFNNLQEALAFMKSESRGGPVKAKLSLRVSKDLLV